MSEFKKKDMIIDFGSFHHPVIVYQTEAKNTKNKEMNKTRNNLSFAYKSDSKMNR